MTTGPETVGQPALLTIPGAAAALGKSERTIWRWIRSGKLHAVDIGGKTCVQLVDKQAPTVSLTLGTASATGAPSERDSDGTQAATTDTLHDRIEQALRDQIRRLEAENSRLWDLMHTMLPAPGPQARGRVPWWAWCLLGVAISAAVLAAGYYLLPEAFI